MDPVFKKLNYKEQPVILVINAPESFKPAMQSIEGTAKVISGIPKGEKVQFAIVFATKQQHISDLTLNIVPHLEGDAILWVCYPKKTSKKYSCDFDRDTGWEPLGGADMDAVRQVAVDEDWSALRFRKTDYIKKITRKESMALSASAKKRTTQKGV